LNRESTLQLFVGMLLLLLEVMWGGAPIIMSVEAQPTQGDSDTNVVNSTHKINSQFQGLNGSNQTDCEQLEYISRTNRSMMQNVLPPVISDI
jgi:hypothetical protein